MAVLRECLRRVWGALRRNPADHDLERELRFHLELAAEELRGRGHSPAEAARLARVRLGGFPQVMEALRDQRGLPWLDDLLTDVRVGVRGLARRPGFTAAAVLTLAIGIGATAAVATVTIALLFQPLPVPDPDELVVVAQLDEHTAVFPHGLSWPEYLDYRERNDVFDGLAARSLAQPLLSIDGRAAERVRVEYVSDNYFEVLQLSAGHGRTFLPGEGRRPGDAPFIVLTHRAWQTRFGGDPAALGQVVRLGPANMTVIGITPEAFTGASGVVPVELYVLATEGAFVEPGVDGTLDQPAPGAVPADGTAAGRRDGRRGRRPARRHRGRAGRGASGREPRQRAPRRRRASRAAGAQRVPPRQALVERGHGPGDARAARRRRQRRDSPRRPRCRAAAGDGPARGSGRHPPSARAAVAHRERAVGGDGGRRGRPRRDLGRRSPPGRRRDEHGGGPVGALRSQPLLAIVRLGAAVIASFGMLGLLLATVGLYGVVSQATAQRRQEFGIRTALGATPAAITRLALRRGVVLTTLGLALGAVAAAGAGRLATGFLVDVRPGDPVVFAVVGFLLAGTALAACLVPSRRAARADPLATLRAD